MMNDIVSTNQLASSPRLPVVHQAHARANIISIMLEVRF